MINFNISLQGILDSYNRFNKVAEEVSVKGVSGLEENIPEYIESPHNVKANIKVIQAEDEMLGSILDIKV